MDKKRKEDGKELISEQCTKDEEACTARGCSYTLAIIIALTTYGIGVLGVLFSAILLIAAFAVYFRGYQTYEDYEYPSFIDKDRRCNEFPTEKIIGVTITSIYFVLFWMVPSHLPLTGLFITGKMKTLSKGLKFLPWI